jgi:hypothetical protein
MPPSRSNGPYLFSRDRTSTARAIRKRQSSTTLTATVSIGRPVGRPIRPTGRPIPKYRWYASKLSSLAARRGRSMDTYWMIDYPEAEAITAVDKLLELRELCEYGDPVGRELADDALEIAARKMAREGLLDFLISRVAKQQRFR